MPSNKKKSQAKGKEQEVGVGAGAEETPVPSKPSSSRCQPAGAPARIMGLTSAAGAALNGKLCECVGLDEKSGRILVTVDGEKRKLQPDNLYVSPSSLCLPFNVTERQSD
jgi:hypothetical protein